MVQTAKQSSDRLNLVTSAANPSQTAHYSIRLICASYPPVLGGTEIEAQRICSALRGEGHDVKVLCVGGAPMPAQRHWIDPMGTPVRLFGGAFPVRLRHYIYALGVAWTLFRERARYDIAYFLMGGVQLALGVPLARMLGKRIVMKFSGSNTIAPLTASRLGRFELRLLERYADRILVLNPAMADEAAAAGLPKEHLRWMPNPVDVARFSPASPARRLELRRKRRLPEEATIVFFVGRLAPEKQIPSLIEAFARIATVRPLLHLVLLGDGPLHQELESLVQRLNISGRVSFAGTVPSDEVNEWLQCGDIFALVSSLEGFPCALVEAMAAGLAAVVSDIPANRQLVENGKHGYTVSCGDREALAEAMLQLVDNSDLRMRFGAAGRQLVVDRFSTDKVLALYEQLFDNIQTLSRQ